MKLTLKTTLLQSMVAKAMKGASCDKMIPLTNLMAISLEDNTLTLITTDASNFLYVRQDKVDGEDFYAVVQADIFSKLVARTTSENITLQVDDGILIVRGNGKYSIELPLDEEGALIVYPDPLSEDFESIEEVDINLSTIKLILATARYALADTYDIPCYTGYYIADKILATDTSKICGIDIALWDTPALISEPMLNLVGVFDEENISVHRNEDNIIFETKTCAVYGPLMDSIDDYQDDIIKDLLATEFDSVCKIPKADMLRLLDRLILFVSRYDKNEVTLLFTEKGLQVSSKRSDSSELIAYADSENFIPFDCKIDIELLHSQVKANVGDMLKISYGNDRALKLEDGCVTQIIALLQED